MAYILRLYINKTERRGLLVQLASLTFCLFMPFSYFIIQLPSTNAIGTTISSFVLSLKHSTRKA